jgi:hypothetical protein
MVGLFDHNLGSNANPDPGASFADIATDLIIPKLRRAILEHMGFNHVVVSASQ